MQFAMVDWYFYTLWHNVQVPYFELLLHLRELKL